MLTWVYFQTGIFRIRVRVRPRLKKPRMPGILSSENRMTLRLLVLSEYQHVTDGHVAYVHVVLKHS